VHGCRAIFLAGEIIAEQSVKSPDWNMLDHSFSLPSNNCNTNNNGHKQLLQSCHDSMAFVGTFSTEQGVSGTPCCYEHDPYQQKQQ
jgi:hypothetical protein